MRKKKGSEREDDAVEHLKGQLYSRKEHFDALGDIRTPLPKSEAEAPVSWSVQSEAAAEEQPSAEAVAAGEGALSSLEAAHAAPPATPPMHTRKKHMSWPAKFLIGSALFFIVAAGAAAYMFFIGANLISPSNIDIQVVAPSLVDSGKEATLQIIVDNRNTAALTLADLVIDYPSGTRDPSNPTQTLSHVRQSVGTINPGQQLKNTVSAIFYGSEGAQETVNVTLEYSVVGSNAIFQKTGQVNFVIGSSPVSVSVNAPAGAISGQPFPIDVTVQSNTTDPLNNIVLQAQYPFGYEVASTTPNALAGGTFWQLGTLSPGASKVIHLMGTLTGVDGDQRVFRFLAGSNADTSNTTVEVPLLTVPQTVTVQNPFITGTIAVNGQSGKVISVSSGQPLQGTIAWKNNLSTTLSNVQLTLSLSGPILDTKSVNSPDGFYQSQNSTIVWSQEQNPQLAQVQPGQSGTLTFSFATLPPGSGGTLITNPLINLNLSVSGNAQDQNGTSQVVSSAASAQVSIASAISLSTQAQHFTGPFTNSGPMPPVAGKDTSYTIVWTVKNSSNTIGGTSVSAVLPAYVRYVAAQGQGLSYNDATRTVTWSLGDVQAGVGYSTAALQAAFQVVLDASVSQVGSSPALTGEAQLSGTDRFAQVGVSANAAAPTTNLAGEPGFVSGMDSVQAQ